VAARRRKGCDLCCGVLGHGRRKGGGVYIANGRHEVVTWSFHHSTALLWRANQRVHLSSLPLQKVWSPPPPCPAAVMTSDCRARMHANVRPGTTHTWLISIWASTQPRSPHSLLAYLFLSTCDYVSYQAAHRRTYLSRPPEP
jgi:hypothetical protein